MKSNSLKGSSIQTVHSVEFKFGMYIIDLWPTYCVDFSEFRINSFFYKSTKNDSYALQKIDSNYKNYASVQTVFSNKMKFDKYIVDPRPRSVLILV